MNKQMCDFCSIDVRSRKHDRRRSTSTLRQPYAFLLLLLPLEPEAPDLPTAKAPDLPTAKDWEGNRSSTRRAATCPRHPTPSEKGASACASLVRRGSAKTTNPALVPGSYSISGGSYRSDQNQACCVTTEGYMAFGPVVISDYNISPPRTNRGLKNR